MIKNQASVPDSEIELPIGPFGQNTDITIYFCPELLELLPKLGEILTDKKSGLPSIDKIKALLFHLEHIEGLEPGDAESLINAAKSPADLLDGVCGIFAFIAVSTEIEKFEQKILIDKNSPAFQSLIANIPEAFKTPGREAFIAAFRENASHEYEIARATLSRDNCWLFNAMSKNCKSYFLQAFYDAYINLRDSALDNLRKLLEADLMPRASLPSLVAAYEMEN